MNVVEMMTCPILRPASGDKYTCRNPGLQDSASFQRLDLEQELFQPIVGGSKSREFRKELYAKKAARATGGCKTSLGKPRAPKSM
jgi:hypothetical protein